MNNRRAREAPARSATVIIPDTDLIFVHAEMDAPGVVHRPVRCHSEIQIVDNHRHHITHLPAGCHVEFTGEGQKRIGVVVGVSDMIRTTRWCRGDRRHKPVGDATTLVINIKIKMQMSRGKLIGTTKIASSGGDSAPEASLTSGGMGRRTSSDGCEQTDGLVVEVVANFPRAPESKIIIAIKVIAKQIGWTERYTVVPPELPWVADVMPWYNRPALEDITLPMDET